MPTWTSKNRHISNRHDTTNLNPLMMHFLFHILCIEKTWFKTFVYSLQSSILPPKTVECFMKNLAPHFILPVLSFLSRLIKCHHNLSQSTNQERILPSLEIRQWQQGATDCGCSLPDLRLLGKTIRKRMPKLVGCREKRRETRWIFLRLKIIGAKAEGESSKISCGKPNGKKTSRSEYVQNLGDQLDARMAFWSRRPRKFRWFLSPSHNAHPARSSWLLRVTSLVVPEGFWFWRFNSSVGWRAK